MAYNDNFTGDTFEAAVSHSADCGVTEQNTRDDKAVEHYLSRGSDVESHGAADKYSTSNSDFYKDSVDSSRRMQMIANRSRRKNQQMNARRRQFDERKNR